MSFHRPLALMLLGLASVQGQEPAPQQPTPIAPPGVPVPGIVPPPPTGAPAGANLPQPQPGANLGETKITEDIIEPKLSGDAMAGLYRKFTGRRVIVTQEASIAEFRFTQEATPQDPLTFAQAAELLKIAATIHGFVFVPSDENPNLDILTLATAGLRPTQRGVKVYSNTDTLPEGDAVISYVMTLDYLKPNDAMNAFTQIIGQFGAFGSIAAVPNASAVVITENTSLIRKLIELKKEIDKPSSQVATRFIAVQYADVTEIAATLTELLTAQQSAQTTAGIQRAGGQPAAPPQGANLQDLGGQAGGASGESTPIQILPDPRTNRIFAMGRPVDLIFVEGLVREFDVETSEKNFLRRKLRFLTVSEFLPIAGDALTRAFTGTGDAGAAGGGQAAGGQGGGGGNRGQTAGGRSGGGRSGNSSGANFGGSTGGGGFGGGGGGGGGASGAGNALSDPDISSAPESLLVGRTLLVADNITNSIVVQGPPSGLEIIERLLDQIDVKPDQVMISTVIGQLTLDDNFSMGLDYLKVGGKFVGRGGAGLGPLLPISPGGTGENAVLPFNPGTLARASGLQVYGRVGDNINIYLDALQEKSDFTVLSRPSIFTANNQKGTISSGERIAIPTSSNSFSNGGASTNIEYQDVVLKLEVIPRVNHDNEISMQIALLSDELNGTQTISGAGSNGTDLSVPRISTREILTSVTVPNNETIVLGGLIISRDTNEKSGIPLLSDIPYLGSLFSRKTVDKGRSELMVFMQPSVVKGSRELEDVQIDMDGRYRVSSKVRDLADGPGVLPPPDAIVPINDKKGSRAVVAPAPAPVEIVPSSTVRPSIRPAHRR